MTAGFVPFLAKSQNLIYNVNLLYDRTAFRDPKEE